MCIRDRNKAKWMPTQLSVKKLTKLRAFYPEAFGLEDEPNKDLLKSLYYLHISNRTFSGEITPLIEDKDFITHMPYANFVLRNILRKNGWRLPDRN